MAQTWQDGYVCDVEYTTNYFNELSPSFLTYIALLNGYDSPDITGEFTYCELGCGQGVSIMSMAAANPKGKFYGFDFNPAQIATIRKVAKEAGLSNVFFYELSFEEAVERYQEFGEFDFIVFHGIYSWVNKANQSNLVEFCARTLKSGGLVYNSYNAMPGWAGLSHMQRLLKESSELYNDRSDVRAKNSFAFLNEFAKTAPRSMGQNVTNWIEGIKKQNVNYIVHEYLHEEWTAHYYIDVQKDMNHAKLNYIAQASPSEAYEHLVISSDAQKAIAKEVPSGSPLYEQMKDYWLNRKFRRDVYIKGAHKLSKNVHLQRLKSLKFILKVDPKKITNEFSVVIKKTNLKEEIYETILKEFTAGTVSIEQIQEKSDLNLNSILLAISLFVSNGYAMPSFYEPEDKEELNTYNHAISKKAVDEDHYKVLVGSNIGSGIHVSTLERIIYDKYIEVGSTKAVLSNAVYEHLNSRGLKASSKESFKTEGAHKKYVDKKCKEWRDNTLPLWKNIGVVE